MSRLQTDPRPVQLARLRSARSWDVVVIGGGATGLGCAVDAASRGLSVLLLEAHDFAKGTSSRATKLIHGGVRYLAQGRVALVREALRERSHLLANAPHLVWPQRFVVPVYGSVERLRYAAGLKLYDWLAGSHRAGRSECLDAAAMQDMFPALKTRGLAGGVSYWDAQFDDAGLAIALMRTVQDLGGLALNYMPVEALLQRGGRVASVVARDTETGERFTIDARTVINATGVWADRIRQLEAPDTPPMLRPSQGVHVVLDASFLRGRDALLIPRTPDGRVLFMVPWLGRVIVGTTDTPRNDLPLEPTPLRGEVGLILDALTQYLKQPPSRADFKGVFVGLRPLVAQSGRSGTAGLSREHVIQVSPGGMVTVTGGKWTTYRLMAEDAVDAACERGGLGSPVCMTSSLPLHGADSGAVVPMSSGQLTEARIQEAVRCEAARTVEDVLSRRSRLLLLDAERAQALAPWVARILARELARDALWQQSQVDAFDELVSRSLAATEVD